MLYNYYIIYRSILAGQSLPRHHPNPLMRGQKIDNLQMCLKFLLEMGFPVKGIDAEGNKYDICYIFKCRAMNLEFMYIIIFSFFPDIIGGNLPLILALCQSLMHHVKKSCSNGKVDYLV